jgi:hypothetical protein
MKREVMIVAALQNITITEYSIARCDSDKNVVSAEVAHLENHRKLVVVVLWMLMSISQCSTYASDSTRGILAAANF